MYLFVDIDRMLKQLSAQFSPNDYRLVKQLSRIVVKASSPYRYQSQLGPPPLSP